MQQALTARLLGAASVVAIYGERINWGVRPQGEPLPGLALQTASPGREYTHDGADPTGNPRIQFDSYGATAAEALAGIEAVRDLIEQPGVVGGVQFTPSIQAAARGPTVEDVGGGRKAHRYSWDFFVWFTPAA